MGKLHIGHADGRMDGRADACVEKNILGLGVNGVNDKEHNK